MESPLHVLYKANCIYSNQATVFSGKGAVLVALEYGTICVMCTVLHTTVVAAVCRGQRRGGCVVCGVPGQWYNVPQGEGRLHLGRAQL